MNDHIAIKRLHDVATDQRMVDARVFVLPQRGEVILSYPSHVVVLFDGLEMRFKSGDTEKEGKRQGRIGEEQPTGWLD